MKAALVTEPGRVEVTTVDDPTPGPADVIVGVAAVGLCGTDLHIARGEHGRLPVVPGHELSGTVVAIGRDVTGLRVGDPVAVDPSLPCGACGPCRRGRSNLCLHFDALGVTVDGGAAEYVRAPAANCVVLAPDVSLTGATLIEPLSCAVHGYDVLRGALGARVLVYGAGTMGLMMLRLAHHTGATAVDVVETNAARHGVAVALGAGAVEESAGAFERGDGWDIVIDATGNPAAIQDALTRVARGGTYLQFGVAAPATRVEIAPYDVYAREITITGSMAILHSFDRAVDLFAGGVIDPAVFVTDQVPLEDYGRALASFEAGHGLKTQVIP